MQPRSIGSALLLGALMLSGPTLSAQDPPEEPELGWGSEADVSYVQASGNSEASSLGFKGQLEHKWEKATLLLKASGLRARSGDLDRRAVGTPEQFVVEERSSSELKAENYLLHGRFDREVSDRFFWHVGATWERDRFAGIENRTVGVLGFGNTLLERERLKLKTTYGVTLTHRIDVEDAADVDRTFLGAQLAWDFELGIGKNGRYSNSLSFDDNLEEVEDFRADMVHGLSVSMNDHLALKVSLQWLYRNRPALVSVPLTGPHGEDAGSVQVPLEKLDTKLTTAIVVSF